MFSLAKGFWNLYFQKPTYKVLVIGLDDAGKTTILNQLKSQYGQKSIPLEKITPTVGLNIARVEMGKYNCLFWDLGGQKLLRSIWKKYYNECHGIIYVIDSNNHSRIQENAQVLRDILANKDLAKVPILILMNKSEQLNDTITSDKLFAQLEINIEDRDFTCHRVSAIEKINLTDPVAWLCETVGDFYKKCMNGEFQSNNQVVVDVQ